MGNSGGDGFTSIYIDIATSEVATGKIDFVLSNDSRLKTGVILDKHGNPSTNPKDFYDGGAMLPFGNHKGYGLMFMIETMVILFCGYVPVSAEEYRPGNPTIITVWNIEKFTIRKQFLQQVRQLCHRVKAGAPKNENVSVLLTGEYEKINFEKRSKSGIPVPETTWNILQQLKKKMKNV